MQFLACLLMAIMTYIIIQALYNLYFHPLCSYPGPLLWRAFRWPMVLSAARGQLPHRVTDLHDRYGPVVRVAPGDLAFTDPQAWQDIYGLQPGRVQNSKDPFTFPPTGAEIQGDIARAPDKEHARLRRLLGAGFTPVALRETESMILEFADILVAQLQRSVVKHDVQDMSQWFAWASFDMMGAFSFGESFGCLKKASPHFFVNAVLDGIHVAGSVAQLERYGIWTLARYILPKSAFQTIEDMKSYTSALVQKPLERGPRKGQADIFNFLLREQDEADGLTYNEIMSNALTLVMAGSDSFVTTMVYCVYLLCKNPDQLRRVQTEVRTAFVGSKDINGRNVNDLEYMLAVLAESMRLFPPGPTGLPRRITNEEGQLVAGHYVPYNTSCAVYQLAANRCESNFTQPKTFLPERWLDSRSPKFANDMRNAVQPFSVGPRSCIGKSFAYAEMRIFLAKILYHFDFELAGLDEEWHLRKKARIAWTSDGLTIRLKPCGP